MASNIWVGASVAGGTRRAPRSSASVSTPARLTATRLPMRMDWDRTALVFAFILGMCSVAGLLAMRKLRDADPADMF